jgi:hypothetical protein
VNELAELALVVLCATCAPNIPDASRSYAPRPPESSQAVSENLKAKTRDPKWIWRISMGPMRTAYANTDLHIQTSRTDVHVSDAELGERTSMGYYEVWNNENPLQFIDEPSNAFVLSAEHPRSKWALTLTVQHPKVLITSEGHNTSARVTGTVDGQPVDQVMDLGTLYPDYRVSQRHLTGLIGVEKYRPVLKKGRLGELVAHVGVAVGAHFGFSQGKDGLAGPDAKEESSSYGIMGPAFQLSQRLVYHLPRDRFTLALIHYSNFSRIKYDFLDGTASHRVDFESFAVNLGYRINGGKRK